MREGERESDMGLKLVFDDVVSLLMRTGGEGIAERI